MIGLVLLAGAAGLTYSVWLKPQLEFAAVATAFAAKKACSCVHVAKLSFEQCQSDFTDDVSMATFTQGDNSMIVSVLGGRVSSEAVYTPGLGCRLLPEDTLKSSESR
jgi:hypothetical protein